MSTKCLHRKRCWITSVNSTVRWTVPGNVRNFNPGLKWSVKTSCHSGQRNRRERLSRHGTTCRKIHQLVSGVVVTNIANLSSPRRSRTASFLSWTRGAGLFSNVCKNDTNSLVTTSKTLTFPPEDVSVAAAFNQLGEFALETSPRSYYSLFPNSTFHESKLKHKLKRST